MIRDRNTIAHLLGNYFPQNWGPQAAPALQVFNGGARKTMSVLGSGQDPSKASDPPGESASLGSSIATSFLAQLRERDAEAWSKLVQIYHPLVRTWCHRSGLPESHIPDVTQEVFRAVAGAIDRFDRSRPDASMRGWLFGITQRQLLAWRRKRQNEADGQGGTEALARFHQVMDSESYSSTISQPESDRSLLVRRALEVLRSSVEPKTFDAFWQMMVDGKSPADVSAALGIKVATLYVIKGRMMRRLRDLLEGDL